jgi:hypothetical protein
VQIGAVVLLFMGFIGHLCVAYKASEPIHDSGIFIVALMLSESLQAGIEPENFCNGKNEWFVA